MSLRQLQQLTVDRVMAAPFMQAVFAQTIGRSHYRAYLLDVHHYARRSAEVLSIAASRLAESQPQVAEYLLGHAAEELGHDSWAHADLRDLGMSENDIELARPSNPCVQMLALEYLYAAHLNPLGLFGWLFVLKSLGGQLSGRIVTELDSALNLQGMALSFFKGTGYADSQHAEDLLAIIDHHVTSTSDREAFVRMMGLSTELYISLLEQAMGAPPLRKPEANPIQPPHQPLSQLPSRPDHVNPI